MSVWDYLLPWKAVPNMIKDVKDVAKPSGKNEHGSIVGAIGKYADPGGALLGDRWMEFWHERVPAKVNEYLEPVGEFHRKYLDPIAMAAPEDSKLQKVPDFVQAKGGDSVAAVLGAIYGLPAIFGAMGGGAAGGAGGAAGGATGGAGGGTAGGATGGGFGGTGMTAQQMWSQGLQQGGSMLQKTAQQQEEERQRAMAQAQAQQGGGPMQARQFNANEALQLIMQLGMDSRSEDELLEKLASLGEPPGQVQTQPQLPQYTPPQQQAPPGYAPRVPQTRGEAMTNPSLGNILLG